MRLTRVFFAGFLLLIFCIIPALADPTFPQLTGRVVDDAHVLSPSTVQALDQKLAQYESSTTNQVVVVTLSSLGGDAIEDYGYKLGRAWQIGQQGKNNGALLIVAPNEHKVRIEVGYGLEGTLTDALSSEIIQGIILPRFRAGQVEQGIVDGTQAILTVLGGGTVMHAHKPLTANEMKLILYGIILFLFVMGKFVLLCSPKFYLNHPLLAMLLLMSNSSSRYGSSGLGSSGWGGGGGFSGGGGSFGGGGASGSW
jgi:uncharacterized protein